MDFFDPESTVKCPYDETHIIRHKRMQPHLHECRKHHPSKDFVKCPFNAAHVIPEAERRWHLSQCLDRHQIHSKILQENADSFGNRGCVETPVYRPVFTHGETWELPEDVVDRSQQFLEAQARPPSPPPPPPRQQVQVLEDELEGLSLRQKQRLYAKRKQEMQAAARTPPRPLDHVHSTDEKVEGSRSLALLKQHIQANDLYTQNLPGHTATQTAVGRGSPLRANRTAGMQQKAIRPGGRARAMPSSTPNSSMMAPPAPSRYQQAYLTPTGRGQGGLPRQPFYPPGDFNSYMTMSETRGHRPGVYGVGVNGKVPMPSTEYEPSVNTPTGRGAGLRMATVAAMGGGDGVLSYAFSSTPTPGSMWKSGPMPGNHADVLGRGIGLGSGATPSMPGLGSYGIPLSQMASQPLDPAPMFSDMSLSSVPQTVVTNASQLTSGQGREPEHTNTDTDDDDRFVDALSCTGGFPQEEAPQQAQSLVSASNVSLGSNPDPVGSWAAHMETMEEVQKAPGPQAKAEYASSTLSGSTTDSDYQDAGDSPNTQKVENLKSNLRKVNKKLRQIKNMEEKKKSGHVLNEGQVEKLSKKETFEREAAELQKLIKQAGGH